MHGCLVHIDLIDGKIWIQRDRTEEGIAADLERAGIPKEHIVPFTQRLIADSAIASTDRGFSLPLAAKLF